MSTPGIAALLEAAKKSGPESLVGRALQRRCEADLRAYFRALGTQVNDLNLGELADQSLENARVTLEAKLYNVLRKSQSYLLQILSLNIYHAMLKSDRITPTQEAVDDIAISQSQLDYLGLSGQEAADYAAERAAEQVRGINDTTRGLIQEAIVTGIEERLGVDGLSRLIRSVMQDMTTTRAATIATTEMANAMSEAAIRKLGRLGIQYKQIILSTDPCPVCLDNADADPLPVNEDYPSGDMRPPFHPNCECALVGARGSEEN